MDRSKSRYVISSTIIPPESCSAQTSFVRDWVGPVLLGPCRGRNRPAYTIGDVVLRCTTTLSRVLAFLILAFFAVIPIIACGALGACNRVHRPPSSFCRRRAPRTCPAARRCRGYC